MVIQLKDTKVVGSISAFAFAWNMAYANFQPAQPNALRILNKRYSDSQHKKWSAAKERVNTWRSYAWELAHRFANRTTIHGINRLLGEGSSRYER